MAKNRVRREGGNKAILRPDLPGLEDSTHAGFTEESAIAVEVDEGGESRVHIRICF